MSRWSDSRLGAALRTTAERRTGVVMLGVTRQQAPVHPRDSRMSVDAAQVYRSGPQIWRVLLWLSAEVSDLRAKLLWLPGAPEDDTEHRRTGVTACHRLREHVFGFLTVRSLLRGHYLRQRVSQRETDPEIVSSQFSHRCLDNPHIHWSSRGNAPKAASTNNL